MSADQQRKFEACPKCHGRGVKCWRCADAGRLIRHTDGTLEHWNAAAIRRAAEMKEPPPVAVQQLAASPRDIIERHVFQPRGGGKISRLAHVDQANHAIASAANEAYVAGVKATRDGLAALITDGHNLRLLLQRIFDAHQRGDEDAFMGGLDSVASYGHEWEKRAKRANVDWWNR